MRKVQKGFTLVELIVVITILAILATIAFISLQGYSQDAKNSKVASDLRTIASSIEASLTEGKTVNSVDDVLDNAVNTSASGAVGTFGSGAYTIADGTNYGLGGVNFVALKQNGDDFKDTDNRQYYYAYAASGADAYYQLAGEVTLASGADQVYVKGNYIQQGTDVQGLVGGIGGTDTNGVQNGDNVSIY